MSHTPEIDVLVIGSGLAGAAAALAAARQGARVVMITKTERSEEGNTWYAQGGIIYHGANDSPERLVADILTAGAGLSDPAAAGLLAREGPRLVKEVLIDQAEVPFDANGDGGLDLTSEAAHSVARIAHYKDATGRAIESSMLARLAREPGAAVLCGRTAVDLLTLSHHSRNPLDIYAPPTCVGAYVFDQQARRVETLLAKETILATGGLGRIYLHTTNPRGACGDGVAMAYRAGARCLNMQFVQFHPTTLYHAGERFLISESLRGRRGAAGGPGRARVHDRLSPRRLARTPRHRGSRHPPDDARDRRRVRLPRHHRTAPLPGCASASRRSTPAASRRESTSPPSASRSCRPRTTVAAASRWTTGDAPASAGCARSVKCPARACTAPTAWPAPRCSSAWCGARAPATTPAWGPITRRSAYAVPEVAPWQYETEPVDPALMAQDWLTIRQTMWNYVGLVRSRRRLERAHEILRELHMEIGQFYGRGELSDELIGLRNGVQTSLAVLLAAMEARESRGCHYRVD